MSKKPKGPVMRWPWCDDCRAHVREVDGVRHICITREYVQLVFEWRAA